MKNIVVVAGTRPEIVKLAPVIWALKDMGTDFILVWSGQHYDYELSQIFFKELDLPSPDFDLDIRSGSHGEQTAAVMTNVEGVLRTLNGGGVVVAEGDTNTVLGTGLAAVKAGWLFGHVEAGLRSFNRVMPEEINRIVAGAVANIHFAPSVNAILNLLYEGIMPWRIHLTGNTIVDVVYKVLPKIRECSERILGELGVDESFGLVTLHRAENVDNHARLKKILSALKEISKEIELVFPMHPRTRRRLSEYNLSNLLEGSSIKVTKPIGYFEFLGLLSRAQLVFTDSGGVQEEAITLAVPCITLRYNTERPETVQIGGNFLVGDDLKRIIETTNYVIENRDRIIAKIKSKENPYGDGKAGMRIAEILRKIIEDEEEFKRYAYKEPDYRDVGHAIYALVDGSKFTRLKIGDIHEEYPGVIVTLVYDEKGDPIIPYPDRIIREGWKLRIWGPQKLIKSITDE